MGDVTRNSYSYSTKDLIDLGNVIAKNRIRVVGASGEWQLGEEAKLMLIDGLRTLDGSNGPLSKGWISVHDAMPEVDRVVIVEGGIARWNGRNWRTLTGEQWPGREIQWEVTHWMPMPDKPNATKEQG